VFHLVCSTIQDASLRPHKIFPREFPTVQKAKPLAHHPEAFANKVYGGRLGNNSPDDGWRDRGHSLIQITGKDAYQLTVHVIGIDSMGTILPLAPRAINGALTEPDDRKKR